MYIEPQNEENRCKSFSLLSKGNVTAQIIMAIGNINAPIIMTKIQTSSETIIKYMLEPCLF